MVSLMYVRKGGHWFNLKQVKRIRPKMWLVCVLIQWINPGYWEIYFFTFH